MHRKQIIHRDIKPENILIIKSEKHKGGRRYCLADFGLACLATDDIHPKRICGTPGYIDPAVFKI